jgi:GT2 family glycosyltransferase
VSVAIPTYGRERVLLNTIDYLMELVPRPLEILVVDQTPKHDLETEVQLARWHEAGQIRWIRLDEPSIPKAMNRALREAVGDVVLFVDDDIRPAPELISAHLEASCGGATRVVAGRVIQPWHAGIKSFDPLAAFHFAHPISQETTEFIGCNFSLPRKAAIDCGGFDENFVKVAYCYEAEFSHRWRNRGLKIWFEARACVDHLKALEGGTRKFGEHLTTIKPDHAVGAYYFALRTKSGVARIRDVSVRFFSAVRTRHHLRRPWWIPLTLYAELRALLWALALWKRGARLLKREEVGRV